MGIKQKDENSAGGLHNALAAGTTIKGNIITGEVDGSVKVSAKLILKSTAIIKGDIYTQSLEIEPNARFNGACSMCSEKKKADK